MSDISLDVTWFDALLFVLLIGSPGLIGGGVIGAIAWRRHRIAGGLLGALSGLVLWAAARLAFGWT